MNVIENLLMTLSEECDEVGQRASKANRFGLSEVQPDQAESNAQRIMGELNDLLGVVELLESAGAFQFAPDRERIDAKKRKVLHYMRYSLQLGTMTDDAGLMSSLESSVGVPDAPLPGVNTTDALR